MERTILLGTRALIVEDNEALAYTLAEYMEEFGVLADFAGNGREAIGLAKKNAYDFILMDIYMPLVNGLEATTQIISIRPEATIIVVTSSSERLEYERMKSAGAKDCIVKPVGKDKLINTVAKYLSPIKLSQ